MLFTDDKFQQLQQTFLDKHYAVFEDSEENKLIYTDIHREYVNILYYTMFICHIIGDVTDLWLISRHITAIYLPTIRHLISRPRFWVSRALDFRNVDCRGLVLDLEILTGRSWSLSRDQAQLSRS